MTTTPPEAPLLIGLSVLCSALLTLIALALPTRRALRSRPINAIGIGE